MDTNNKILLNEIFKFDNLDNVKIRFNIPTKDDEYDPMDLFKSKNFDALLGGQYWNYSKKSYQLGQITIGLLRLHDNNLWLLFHVGRVTKDLDINNGVGYEYDALPEYEKYLGRLIVKFKNKSQTLVRLADSVIDECEVVQLLPDTFDNDIFPGYDKVRLTWKELARSVGKESWKTALQNQKGVYLITDRSNGKMYVGSAYGENMLLARWNAYINSGHGGNVELKKLDFKHIQENFEYSILDIFKSTIDDQTVFNRESWWKNILNTREFGYNKN